jgi:hypothetical protein
MAMASDIRSGHQACTHPNRVGLNNKGLEMNIELDEVAAQDVSDDALELAAGGGSAYAQASWFNFQTHCVA